MSSAPIIGVAVLVFCIAALLYYQSRTVENFDSNSAEIKNMLNAWASWGSSDPPIAGRLYNPQRGINASFSVPHDLNRAPVSKPGAIPPGSLPTAGDNRSPGAPPSTRQSMAQSKDLSELDSKIMVWLEAASQREAEKPGSLTSQQLEQRIILQARLEDIRQQLGLNNITDNYVTVANEIMALRRENAGWQHQAPFVSAAFDYGAGVNPDALITKDQYDNFFEIFGEAIKELKDLYQPDPLQKVRLQQLQVIRQSLIDSSSPTNPPPIRMGAAQLFLRQMLRPEQPLPTLYSLDFTKSSGSGSASGSAESNSDDIMEYLRSIKWKLTMGNDPEEDTMKQSTSSVMTGLLSGEITSMDARRAAAVLDAQIQPSPIGTDGPILDRPMTAMAIPVRPMTVRPMTVRPMMAIPVMHRHIGHVVGSSPGSIEQFTSPAPDVLPNYQIIDGAKQLCDQIREAFPRPHDAAALGCGPITTQYQAETVINTVCNNLRSSVPTVSPEQFYCSALKQMIKSDGDCRRISSQN